MNLRKMLTMFDDQFQPKPHLIDISDDEPFRYFTLDELKEVLDKLGKEYTKRRELQARLETLYGDA